MKLNLFLIVLFTGIIVSAQDSDYKSEIDSLNNVSYEKRIATDSFNVQKYLDNLNKSQKINYPKGIAESYANLSLIYFYKGKYDISTDYFLKAINQFKSIGEFAKAGELYGLYGYRLKNTDLKKAAEYMQTGIHMAEKANAKTELLSLYDNYGVIKEQNGEYDSAFYFYNKSLSMKESANDEVGIPYSLNKIASLKTELGNYKEAKELFDQAYKLRLKLNDKVGIAENLSFYGTFYEIQNNHTTAINYFKQALEASKKAGYSWLTYKLYNALSDNSVAKGDYKNAFDYLKDQMVYRDSIYNMESTVNRNELEVQFETNEKEKKILEQRADLAEKKLELEQKNIALYSLGFLILLIGIITFMIYRTQKIKNKQLKRENELKDSLIKIEAENKVQQERLRISRDLHDNIGSQLTFIISSLDNLKFRLANKNPEAEGKLGEINHFTKNTINELRDTIWAMSKENISFADLRIRIHNFIENAKLAAPQINFKVEISPEVNESHNFSAFEGINLYRLIQEAVNNAIKYSGALEIKINFEKQNGRFKISISDNGKGIPADRMKAGNGMGNMKNRIEEMGGNFKIDSTDGKGTKLEFTF